MAETLPRPKPMTEQPVGPTVRRTQSKNTGLKKRPIASLKLKKRYRAATSQT